MAAEFSKRTVEPVSLDVLFKAYCQMDQISDEKNVENLPLTQCDNWLRAAKILDDHSITTTDTGLCFFKFRKRAVTYDEFLIFLHDLSNFKKLDFNEIQRSLLTCPIPRNPRGTSKKYQNC